MKFSAFKKIAQALHEEDVRYLLAGGLAVVAHGYGRMTFFVEIPTLIAMKRIAGREKDMDDIRHLEMIARES